MSLSFAPAKPFLPCITLWPGKPEYCDVTSRTCDRTPNKKGPTSMAENALMESEASVLATFDFLGNVNTVDDEENLRLGDFISGGKFYAEPELGSILQRNLIFLQIPIPEWEL